MGGRGQQNEIQTHPNPPRMDSDDDSDDDLEVIDSPLNQKLTCQGVTIDVAIYKGREGRWILEVVDYCDNTSYLWNDHFETDQHALDEAIRSFEEDPTAYSGALDHERYRTIKPPITASVHCGTPPKGYREWTTTKIHFHGFLDLSTERGVGFASPEFMALGNTWLAMLYPGGHNKSRPGWIAVFLKNQSNMSIKVKLGFRIINRKGKQVANKHKSTYSTLDPNGSPGCLQGWRDIVERSAIIDSLVDGTLVIEVNLRFPESSKSNVVQFIPENPFCNNTLQMFNDEESSDIVFEVVGRQSKSNAEKLAKIAPVTFHAHCLILKAGSAVLAALCQSREDPTTPIEITDVSPEIFGHLLYYIYGGKISDADMKAHSKEIVNAANRFGLTTLKACLVYYVTFKLDNVMELLIYADSMSCALLKEAAMDYVLENKAQVLEKISFDDAPGNLMRDLLAAVVRGERKEGEADGDNSKHQFTTMGISELRKEAHDKGLDVDGSREMLLAALKAYA